MTGCKVQSFPQKEIRSHLFWIQIWMLFLNSHGNLDKSLNPFVPFHVRVSHCYMVNIWKSVWNIASSMKELVIKSHCNFYSIIIFIKILFLVSEVYFGINK